MCSIVLFLMTPRVSNTCLTSNFAQSFLNLQAHPANHIVHTADICWKGLCVAIALLINKIIVNYLIHQFPSQITVQLLTQVFQSFDHQIIQSSNHRIIQSSNHPIIQSSNHPLIHSSNPPIIQSSNHPT